MSGNGHGRRSLPEGALVECVPARLERGLQAKKVLSIIEPDLIIGPREPMDDLVTSGVAFLIAWRRSREPVALFISLALVLPAVRSLLARGGRVVALVKPQFEAGRDEVRKGIIHDPAIHARVLEQVSAAAAAVGLSPAGSTPSPITGQKGNVELLLHLRVS